MGCEEVGVKHEADKESRPKGVVFGAHQARPSHCLGLAMLAPDLDRGQVMARDQVMVVVEQGEVAKVIEEGYR